MTDLAETYVREPLSEPFDIHTEVGARLRLQLSYYQHPLIEELCATLSGDHEPADRLASVVAAEQHIQTSANTMAAEFSVKAGEQVERNYPDGLSDQTVNLPSLRSLGRQTGLHRSEVAETYRQEVASAKTALLGTIQEDEPPEPAIDINREEILQYVDDALASQQQLVTGLVESIAEGLRPKHNRAAAFVLAKAGRANRIFGEVKDSSERANLHRAFESLIAELRTLSDPGAIGRIVAGKLDSHIASQASEQLKPYFDHLIKESVSQLAASLGSLTAEDIVSSVRQQKPASQAVAAIATPAVETARAAAASSGETESQKPAVDKVGIAKKIGSRTGSNYIVETLDIARGLDVADAMAAALMTAPDITGLLVKHPELEEDIQTLMKGLVIDPNCRGTEKLQFSMSVSDPTDLRRPAIKAVARRLSPKGALKEGASSGTINQLRFYYLLVDIEGVRTLAIVKAGNKQSFAGHFERHM